MRARVDSYSDERASTHTADDHFAHPNTHPHVTTGTAASHATTYNHGRPDPRQRPPRNDPRGRFQAGHRHPPAATEPPGPAERTPGRQRPHGVDVRGAQWAMQSVAGAASPWRAGRLAVGLGGDGGALRGWVRAIGIANLTFEHTHTSRRGMRRATTSPQPCGSCCATGRTWAPSWPREMARSGRCLTWPRAYGRICVNKCTPSAVQPKHLQPYTTGRSATRRCWRCSRRSSWRCTCTNAAN